MEKCLLFFLGNYKVYLYGKGLFGTIDIAPKEYF